ncbi:hypothetical protein R5R35_011802 [Gryllus longicercus]|uniref:Uncharacterized protein n=1 Tax=Gryllus longicercus TaxID=2509291 RepID=A0AAN9VX05_9ORTH
MMRAGVGGVPRDFEETVEQLRERLAAMKRLVGDDLEKQRAQRAQQHQQRSNSNGDSIIDGKFLSVVFAVVLLLIICVSSYAFLNLYYAILKKFPAREHSEL